ncbi:hypothetical protein RISK_006636 [Rhodopirellula islandica]|uniref:Uncharacterized protein n=1 Tax=Rhodopirellula islandica TaxID=595434 RepID=A0A0J1B3S1_RHOIS|nr:hypothetical protein RISK_006636 [Rhodopirellula islandica]
MAGSVPITKLAELSRGHPEFVVWRPESCDNHGADDPSPFRSTLP